MNENITDHSVLDVETPEAISRHLGDRVKRLRTDRGWSLEALANASGVSRSIIGRAEATATPRFDPPATARRSQAPVATAKTR